MFERRQAFREDAAEETSASSRYDFLLFGLGRYGREIGRRLARDGYTVYGVDFDPEFIAHLPLAHVRGVISAIPRNTVGLTDTDPRLALLHGLRSAGYHGHLAVAMHTPTDADLLRAQDVELILTPFSDAADFAVAALEKSISVVQDR